MASSKLTPADVRQALTDHYDIGGRVELILRDAGWVEGTLVRYDDDAMTVKVGAEERTVPFEQVADFVAATIRTYDAAPRAAAAA